MAKQEISLSPNAIGIINRLLSDGNRVQIDFDPRTKNLTIYKVPRLKTEYRVVVTDG